MTIYYSQNKTTRGYLVPDNAGKSSAAFDPPPTRQEIPGTIWHNTATNQIFMNAGVHGWWRIPDFGAL